MALAFSKFDSRNYQTVSTRDGYGEWGSTYEQSVCDIMDIRLLDRLNTVPWSGVRRAVDLGCGTGRIGVWLANHGVARVDGIDITPEMLQYAEAKGAYQMLNVGDVLATGLSDAYCDLAIAALIDEHIHDLDGLYREAARINTAGGWFVIVGYHPSFIMTTGMPTHFHRDTGEAVAIETHVHLFSDHFKAARRWGFSLSEMEEGLIDAAWITQKPKWHIYEGRPISFAFVWRKAGVA